MDKYSWVILKNRDDITFYKQPKYNIHIGEVVNTEMIINIYYNLNSNFKYIFELKELYIKFNSSKYQSSSEVEDHLD